MTSILTKGQKKILNGLPKSIKEHFVFSGGTALAEFYLSHRLSDDLDFFAQNTAQKVNFTEIKGILIQNQFHVESVTKIYDRCVYYIRVENEQIKIEFVPLYFDRLQKIKHNIEFNLFIESLNDLTANKIMALADRFEIKDFVDIFFIAQKTGWSFLDMIALARQKEDLPYEYTVNLSRIFSFKDSLNLVRKRSKFELDQIIQFYKQSDNEIKEYLIKDF